MIHISI